MRIKQNIKRQKTSNKKNNMTKSTPLNNTSCDKNTNECLKETVSFAGDSTIKGIDKEECKG